MSTDGVGDCPARPLPQRRERGYSRAFPAAGARSQLAIDRVPRALLVAFRAQCVAEGVSQRAVILGWIRSWVRERGHAGPSGT